MKKLLKFLQNVFNKKHVNTETENIRPKIKIKDLNIFDDVYIIICNEIYPAWVVQKTSSRIILTYTLENKAYDMQFIIDNLDENTVIKESNRKLILNKEDVWKNCVQ